MQNTDAPDGQPSRIRFKNPHRISIAQWREDNGYTDEDDFLTKLEEISLDGMCPAMCDVGCEVEPDGKCMHRCPSLLLAGGYV